MNESDTDTGLEETGEPAGELPDEPPTGTESGPAGKAGTGDDAGDGAEGPWEPPSEEEHLDLLDIRDKAALVVEQLQRTTAEFENYKKRQSREEPRARAAAVRGFIEGLLPVIDNFERAIESADSQEGGAEGLLDGVRLISQMISKLLADHDVVVVETEGRQFNPAFHEAVLEEEVTEGSTGDILEVHEKGYLHGEVLVRPSRVKVAKRVDADEGNTAPGDGEQADSAQEES